MFLVPLLFIIGLFLLIPIFVNSSRDCSVRDHSQNRPYYDQSQAFQNNRALEILRERFAKGEISEEEFQRIKRNLES